MVLAVLVAIVGAITWRDTNRPILRTVHVPISGLDRTYRVLHIADLHGARFGEGQQILARLVEGKKYDAIAFTGDAVLVRFADSEPAVELVEALSGNGPILFVHGNHDDPRVGVALVSAGATALDDVDSVRIGPDDAALVLSTFDGAQSARERDSDLLVVLEHTPLSGSQLTSISGAPAAASVVLSGHTHAGNIRLPWLGPLIAPPMGDVSDWTWLPEHRGVHTRGLERREGVWVHITPGLGSGTFKSIPIWLGVRFGSRAEMTEVIFEPEPQALEGGE